MPGFELNTDCRAPVEEVWKLLFDPDRFLDWWAGIEAVRKDAPGQFTLWPPATPTSRCRKSCGPTRPTGGSSSPARSSPSIWSGSSPKAGTGTSIHLNVTAPESQAHRLDRQRQLIEESLRRLTTLAEAAS